MISEHNFGGGYRKIVYTGSTENLKVTLNYNWVAIGGGFMIFGMPPWTNSQALLGTVGMTAWDSSRNVESLLGTITLNNVVKDSVNHTVTFDIRAHGCGYTNLLIMSPMPIIKVEPYT